MALSQKRLDNHRDLAAVLHTIRTLEREQGASLTMRERARLNAFLGFLAEQEQELSQEQQHELAVPEFFKRAEALMAEGLRLQDEEEEAEEQKSREQNQMKGMR